MNTRKSDTVFVCFVFRTPQTNIITKSNDGYRVADSTTTTKKKRTETKTTTIEKENDVFVKLKVYDALNAKQQSKIAKKNIEENKVKIK